MSSFPNINVDLMRRALCPTNAGAQLSALKLIPKPDLANLERFVDDDVVKTNVAYGYQHDVVPTLAGLIVPAKRVDLTATKAIHQSLLVFHPDRRRAPLDPELEEKAAMATRILYGINEIVSRQAVQAASDAITQPRHEACRNELWDYFFSLIKNACADSGLDSNVVTLLEIFPQQLRDRLRIGIRDKQERTAVWNTLNHVVYTCLNENPLCRSLNKTNTQKCQDMFDMHMLPWMMSAWMTEQLLAPDSEAETSDQQIRRQIVANLPNMGREMRATYEDYLRNLPPPPKEADRLASLARLIAQNIVMFKIISHKEQPKKALHDTIKEQCPGWFERSKRHAAGAGVNEVFTGWQTNMSAIWTESWRPTNIQWNLKYLVSQLIYALEKNGDAENYLKVVDEKFRTTSPAATVLAPLSSLQQALHERVFSIFQDRLDDAERLTQGALDIISKHCSPPPPSLVEQTAQGDNS